MAYWTDSGDSRGERYRTKEKVSYGEALQILRTVLMDYKLPDPDEWYDATNDAGRAEQSFRIIRGFYKIENPTEEDEFTFVEALKYVIEEVRNIDEPVMRDSINAMKQLAWFYGTKKEFELERKYLERAAAESNGIDL